jgi:hypothetical protein
MGEIRGEKVVFRKEDIVPLHELPSAQAHDPILLHATDRPSRTGLACRIVGVFVALVLFAGVIVVGIVETGLADGALNARAVSALNRALGPRYSASVEHTVLRFSGLGGLALKAQNARITEIESGRELATTASVALVLDPVALLSGRIAISRLDVDGAMFNAALLPESAPIDLSLLRISDVPDYLETAFGRLDGISQLIAVNGMETVRVSDLGITLKGSGGKALEIAIASLQFTRSATGTMAIDGHFAMDGKEGEIDLTASGSDGAITAVDGAIRQVALDTFLLVRLPDGDARHGVDSVADVSVSARRERPGAAPRLSFDVALGAGSLYADGIVSEIRSSTLQASYNFGRGSIELASTTLGLGHSTFPFTGGLIDLDRVSGKADKGFAVDLLFRDAIADPLDTNEQPIRFDAKVNGHFLPATGDLLFDELAVSSEKGALAGSLALRFGDKTPEVSFVMIADRLESAAVKQFWPYWMAKTARSWVARNIYGGTVANGRIELFLPAGRIPSDGSKLELRGDSLKIDFDIEGARMNIAGEIPPLRDTSGHFKLRGEKTEIAISGGAAYFPSGRSVMLKGGTFVLPDGHMKPLMAEMDIDVAGSADAIAELVTYKPIRALPATGFSPEDFTGPVTANVKATFGVIAAHNPPPPIWSASLLLDGVDLKKPVAGRAITDVDGTLEIDPKRADLKGTAKLDDVQLNIELVEPVGAGSGVTRITSIFGTLSNAERRKILPGFENVVDGPVKIRVEQKDKGTQNVEADVGGAAVSIPWLGWTKGAGVGAKVTFVVENKDGLTSVSDFKVDGDGFGAAGALQFRGSSLDTARLSNVRLSADDRFSLSIERKKSGYDVVAEGDAADIRPVLARLKTAQNRGGGGNQTDATIRANLGRVTGFNGEALTNVNLRYSTAGNRISALDLTAVAGGGSPVVAKLAKDGGADIIVLTSGDAGAVARFADVYSHLRGGLLNVRLREGATQGWRGSVDVRKFSLVGEERLRSLVSTPTGEGGRSLNQAVRRDIDVSSVRFERGFASLSASGGTLQVENGVVRGDTVGATFQGTIRDANGNIDMTGTFMPAYGLNRLFAELPLIGIILGNGRDRGLIGITFKLSGAFDKPRLAINPLSIIAPGVFRNIFEFQ